MHVKTELYNAILKKAQQQRLAVTASIGNLQIVDFALTPANPYWPKPGLLLTISSLLGLLLGAGWTIFRFTLQNRDNFPVLLEYQTEMPLSLKEQLALANEAQLVEIMEPGGRYGRNHHSPKR